MQRNSTPIPYSPGPSPAPSSTTEQITRAIWDELFRIQQSLSDLDLPNLLTVTSTEGVTTSTSEVTPTWNRMFNNTPTIVYELPTNTFSTTTGVWTAPQEGIYQISCQVQLPKNDLVGNNNYYAIIRCTIDPILSGAPNVVFSRVGGGNEEVPLTVTLISMIRCAKGDTVVIDVAAINPKAVSTLSAQSSMSIIRQSGVRPAI